MSTALFTASGLTQPVDVIYANSAVHALNSSRHGGSLIKYDGSGVATVLANTGLANPVSICYDSTNTCFYVLNAGPGTGPFITKITSAGTVTTFVAAADIGLANPVAITCNAATIYVVNAAGGIKTISVIS